MEKNSHSTITVKNYIDEIKATVDLTVWTAIADDTNVQSALDAVATIGYSHSNEFYHSATYLLNCISRAYLEAKSETKPNAKAKAKAKPKGKAKARVASDPAETFAVVFSSARKPIPGDYLGAHVKPDLHAFTSDAPMLSKALKASAKAPFSKLVKFPLNLSFGEWKGGAGGLGQLLWYLSALKRCRPDLPTVHGLFVDDSRRLMLISVNACGSWSSEPVNMGFEEVDEAQSSDSGCNPDDEPGVKTTVPSTDTWIAYVVILYKTHIERDARFSLAEHADDTALWNIQLPGLKSFTVRPFHATHCPGRMTWASFVLDLSDSDTSSSASSSTPPSASSSTSPSASPSTSPSTSPSQSSLARGFLKTSWQDSLSSFTETDMLDAAHQYGWVPGLVRHWTAVIDPPPHLTLHDGSSQPARMQEFVYLASLGQPLSQCKSALHLLKVIYDAAETHLQLLMLDVLHGDISWFNILCNPWHDKRTLDDRPVLEDVPCIDYILTNDAVKSQPCALLLDLDHAARISSLYSETYSGGREKTGTPMFVSVELSSKSPVQCGSNVDLAKIVGRLAVLDDPKYSELKARAFPGPGGDNDFMKNLREVVKMEAERIARGDKPYTNPASLHHPHHDVESLYWVLAWALGRACPLGENPHGSRNDAFTEFADTMLEHCLGQDAARSRYLRNGGIEEAILHPLLRKHFHPVLETLATYLAVPWHLYVDIVHASHAHVAIRRILLPLIHDIDQGNVDDVVFNTMQPRTMLLQRSDQDRKNPTGPGTPGIMRPSSDRLASANLRSQKARTEAPPSGLSSPSATQSSVPPTQPSSGPSVLPDSVALPPGPPVRPASVTLAPGPSSVPGHVRRPPRPPSALDGIPQGIFSKVNRAGVKRVADSKEEEPVPKRAKTEAHETDVVKTDPRDVETLIKMFWADRRLWFGTGFLDDGDWNAASAAARKEATQ